ncbi:Protein SHQ1 like, partial [Dissostichus eleginoides]
MITPAFDLSQDPEYLILCIRVPYTRTSEFDLFIDGTDFKFYAKPYFLRLSLPGQVVEDGREKAKFDIDKGLFTVWVPKETTGEHFEGLQMLTSLLAPKGARSAKPLIEDVSTGCSEGKYGFGNQRSGVFARLQEELTDVIDVKNPEGATAAERRRGRLEVEASDFSPDHYLADLFEDEEIKRLLKFSPWWAKLSPTEQEEAAVLFTDGEKEQLRKFTNRSYLLDKASRNQVWLSLVDILLTYSYEVAAQRRGRVTVDDQKTQRDSLLAGDVHLPAGRPGVLWTEGAVLPALQTLFHGVCGRSDTTKILQSGKAGVLKCLLDIHKVFRENDPAYILNDLYITDYCTWIQRVNVKGDKPFMTLPNSQSLITSRRESGSGGGEEPRQSTLLSAEDKVNALPSASEGSRQLIQELGERVTEELNISEDSTAEERTSSRANG